MGVQQVEPEPVESRLLLFVRESAQGVVGPRSRPINATSASLGVTRWLGFQDPG